MPLWGSVDNAANSDIAAVIQYKRATTSANQTALFDNSTQDAFITNATVGQFGVDTQEMNAVPAGTAKPAHAGWNIRTVGTGGRAGRVSYETLVAMGSMSGDAEDAKFPDYTLSITTQPSSANGAGNVTLTVVATSRPTGATLTYAWQRNAGAGWVAVTNTASVYYVVSTSPNLIANAAVANANTFRVIVNTTGTSGNTISANASVTKP